MASVDGSKTIYASSDQVFEHVCGPCKSEGSEVEAKEYCGDCSDFLCDPCVKYHRKLPLLKNHKILSADDVSGTGPRLTLYCKCNNNQEIEFYCDDHSSSICGQCQMLLHHKCQTIPIQQKSSAYTSTHLDSIISKTKSLKDKYDELKQGYIEDKKELEDNREECKKAMQAFRKELDDYIDKLEREMLEELNKIETKEHRRIDQKIATITTALQMLDVDYKLLGDAKNDGRKHIMFAADVEISKRFREFETRLAELEKEAVKLSLTFDRNGKLNDLPSEKNIKLGAMKIFEKASTKSKNTALIGRHIQSQGEANVRLIDDRKTPSITGFAIMPNGYVVISDGGNAKIKVLDSSLMPMGSMKLTAWDLSSFDDNNVIVTLFEKKKLQIIHVFPKLLGGRITNWTGIVLESLCLEPTYMFPVITILGKEK